MQEQRLGHDFISRNPSYDELHQLGVVGDDVVLDVLAVLLVERREELAGAFDLGVFDALELKGRERALGLGDEVDVLDAFPRVKAMAQSGL